MHRSDDPTVRVLAALADPIRLDMVRQLSHGEDVRACDFDVCRKIAQPTVSHHLRILREAGIVRAERRGTYVHFALQPTAAERLTALVRGLRPPSTGAAMPRTGRMRLARTGRSRTP